MTIIARMAVAAGGLAIAAASSGAAQADTVYSRYELLLGGTPAAKLETEITINGGDYRVAAQAELTGGYAVMADWDLTVRTVGLVQGESLLPLDHYKVSDGGDRWVQINYADGLVTNLDYRPSSLTVDVQGLSQETIDTAIDPLTAIAMLSRQVGETGNCSATAWIFDGRKYFEATVTHGGQTTPPAGDYSGSAYRCVLQLDDASPYGRVDDDPNRFDLWIAQPVAGAPYVPVVIDTRVGWGSVRVVLLNARSS